MNIPATRALAEAVDIPVIASGGVSCLDDIRALLPLEALGVIGVITGRALYDGSLDLAEAIRLAQGETVVSGQWISGQFSCPFLGNLLRPLISS